MFEQLFFRAAGRNGMGVLRIPDGCKRVPGKGARGLLIAVKTPCDYVLMNKGKCALIDTKTQGGGQTFPKSNINHNQVFSMHYMTQHGAIGGYIVWFREIDKVVFYESNLLRLAQEGLHWEDGLFLGTIEDLNLEKIYEL